MSESQLVITAFKNDLSLSQLKTLKSVLFTWVKCLESCLKVILLKHGTGRNGTERNGAKTEHMECCGTEHQRKTERCGTEATERK